MPNGGLKKRTLFKLVRIKHYNRDPKVCHQVLAFFQFAQFSRYLVSLKLYVLFDDFFAL